MLTDTPGFALPGVNKLGTRSVDSCEIHFDNCRIPQRYLGLENAGFYHIMTNFQGERLVGIVGYTGMEIAVEDCIKYGKERELSVDPLESFRCGSTNSPNTVWGLLPVRP